MKKQSLLITLFVCLFTIGQAKNYVDYVSPLVGTQSTFELSTGNTYPAIARPWGMNFWTPQTGKWETDGNILTQLPKYAVSNRHTNPVRG